MHRRFLSSVAPSVRARLWFLVAVVAVPAALLSGWLIFRSYRTEWLAMERRLVENARGFSALIDAELRERVAMAQSLAGTHALLSGDLAAFRVRAERLVVRPGEWVMLVDADGRELVNTRLPADAELSRVAIAAEIAAAPDRALPYVSNLIVADETPRHSVWVMARARIGNDDSGFVILALTPEALQASLMRDRLRDRRVIAVIDRNQIVVARSRAPEAFVGEQATAQIRQAAAGANEGVTESVTLDGYPSIAAFSTSTESGWMVVVASHKSDLFDPAKQ
ncbi:MAG TPA: cache domain-containing protein, partial [Opitutus sp.]|nr:cache domain-containing protein [Opitutus sp.]